MLRQNVYLDPRMPPRDYQVRRASLDVVYDGALLAHDLTNRIDHLAKAGELHHA